MDARQLQSDLVLLGHYHFHTKVGDGMWYAGSTDTFSFADDPDKAKGIVVLDTDTGTCRHVPLTGQRPLVTLETVFAIGLSPAEVQDAGARAGRRRCPRAPWPGSTWTGSTRRRTGCSTCQAVREAARAALLPQARAAVHLATTTSELPEMDGMGGAVGPLSGQDQDLTGLDRERVRRLGLDYIDSAIEAAGTRRPPAPRSGRAPCC